MVPWIDGGGDQSSSFRVCASNNQKVGSHDVCLCPYSYKAIDVLTDWH